jgi:hypothetical protein
MIEKRMDGKQYFQNRGHECLDDIGCRNFSSEIALYRSMAELLIEIKTRLRDEWTG